MAYGGSGTERTKGLAQAITTFLESIGLLNKGSADAQAALDTDETAQIQPISSNTLNVTRVSGLATLITVVGAAMLGVFNVNKKADPPSVVVGAYVSVGVVIAAALLTAAVIISADIRSRTTVAVAHYPDPRPLAGQGEIPRTTVEAAPATHTAEAAGPGKPRDQRESLARPGTAQKTLADFDRRLAALEEFMFAAEEDLHVRLEELLAAVTMRSQRAAMHSARPSIGRATGPGPSRSGTR